MRSSTILITVVWLLPLLVNAAVPLVMAAGRRVSVRVNRLRLREVVKHSNRENEKRRHRRAHADALRIVLRVPGSAVCGTVCDVSTEGLCVMGIPEGSRGLAKHLSAEVDIGSGSYFLWVTPRWRKHLRSGRQIGLSIDYAPDAWYELVRRHSHFALA